ncbi:MAG: hypothetical protein M5U27_02310 [Gaiella sp.]|nr:hypothetical protein [Gaiella sp.]
MSRPPIAQWAGARSSPVFEEDLQLAFDDEEHVRVVVVDVRSGPPLARAVVELGHRQVVGVREQRHPAVRACRDGLAVDAAGADDHDRRRVGASRGRGCLLVERGARPRELLLGGDERLCRLDGRWHRSRA